MRPRRVPLATGKRKREPGLEFLTEHMKALRREAIRVRGQGSRALDSTPRPG